MSKNERGAAAVEFALIVPLLVALIAGIADFGRAYHLQTTITGAAREAVRLVALRNDPATARSAAKSAASPLTLTDDQISLTTCPATPSPTANAVVTIRYETTYLSGLFGASLSLTGKAVMRCGG